MTNTLTPKQTKVINPKLDKIIAALLEDNKQYIRFQLQLDELVKEDSDLAYDFVIDVYKQMFYRNGRITQNQVEFKKPNLIQMIRYYISYFTFILAERKKTKTKLTKVSRRLRKVYDEKANNFHPDLSEDQKLMWKLAYTYAEILDMHQFFYNLALNVTDDDEEHSDSRYYDTFVADMAKKYNTLPLAKFEECIAKDYAEWLEYANENYQYAFWKI